MNEILCEVCYRPGPEAICSRRCQGLAKQKRSLDHDRARSLVLNEIQKLKKDESVNPAKLSKIVLNQMGVNVGEERDALSLLREIYFQLRQDGAIRFFHKNQLIPKGKGPLDYTGPFDLRGR